MVARALVRARASLLSASLHYILYAHAVAITHAAILQKHAHFDTYICPRLVWKLFSGLCKNKLWASRSPSSPRIIPSRFSSCTRAQSYIYKPFFWPTAVYVAEELAGLTDFRLRALRPFGGGMSE